MTLLLLKLLRQLEGARAPVIGAGEHDNVEQCHGSDVRRTKRRSSDRGQKKFVGKLPDGGNQRVRDAHTVSTLFAAWRRPSTVCRRPRPWLTAITRSRLPSMRTLCTTSAGDVALVTGNPRIIRRCSRKFTRLAARSPPMSTTRRAA